jgi:hypothetical protein
MSLQRDQFSFSFLSILLEIMRQKTYIKRQQETDGKQGFQRQMVFTESISPPQPPTNAFPKSVKKRVKSGSQANR